MLQYLREAGGSRDANVDGSSTPVEFSYTADDTRMWIYRLMVSVKDAGSFDADLYGNGEILANGIDLEVVTAGGETHDLLDGEPIKANADWGICHDVRYFDIGPAADNYLLVRWTFARAGRPLRLGLGDKLLARVNDDLTGLTGQWFHAQGIVPL